MSPEVTSLPVDADVRRALDGCWAGGERLDELARYALHPPGKLLRPLLLVSSAEAVGGDRATVLPAALAVECLHVATLVHDDIIDGDDLRRGRASVHARFGVPDAIVTGDALIFGVFAAVAECRVPHARVVAAIHTLAQTGELLCRGQVKEALLTLPGSADPTTALGAYLEVAALKTGALFRGACRAGALLGGGTAAQADLLSAYADHIGLAFQMYDDLLPYLGDPAVTGKPGTSDAANLRPTFPVLLAHREGDQADRRRIERVFHGMLAPSAALAELREAIASTGAIDLALARARDEVRLARASLAALPGSKAVDLLGTIAELTVRRDR